MRVALYPGTFDPATNGHLDIVRRGSALFDRVVVAVGVRGEKATLFSSDERVALFRESVADLDNVSVEPFDGLVVHFAQEQKATVLLRGVRNVLDYAYETQMAVTNRKLAPALETMVLIADPEVATVSSTLVREIHKAGGDLAGFVPAPVLAALAGK